MSDTSSDPNATSSDPNAGVTPTTVIPTLAERLMVTVSGQAGTALGAALVTYGLATPATAASFGPIAAGIILAAGNMAITWIIAKRHDARLRAAVAAPAAVPVTKP